MGTSTGEIGEYKVQGLTTAIRPPSFIKPKENFDDIGLKLIDVQKLEGAMVENLDNNVRMRDITGVQ